MSRKTARLIKWAYASTNAIRRKVYRTERDFQRVKYSCCELLIHPFTLDLFLPSKVQFSDVEFVKRVHHIANVLGDELKVYSNSGYMRENKARYFASIKMILNENKSILAKNLKLIKSTFELKD